MTTWLWLLLFGMAIGAVSGLLGIGGGVIMIPGLMVLFSMTQPQAQGTTLAVMVPPITLFAALVYYRHGDVELPKVGFIAFGFVVGAYLGALLVQRLETRMWLLRVGFGLLLLYLGFLMVFSPTGKKSAAALPAGLATLLAALFGWRRRRRKPPPPPDDDGIEYHI